MQFPKITKFQNFVSEITEWQPYGSVHNVQIIEIETVLFVAAAREYLNHI